MSWVKRKIGDVCIVGDGAHASIKRESNGILYLTCKNFKEGRLELSNSSYISEDNYSKYFKHNSKALTQPKVGDVLFSIIGTIGEPYLYKDEDFFGLSSSVSILRLNGKFEILPSYLYYWIKNREFQKAIFNIKGGVAQGYLSLDMIRALPINYPSFSSTQEKIVTTLSAYDDLIENNRRRIQLLEQSARLLYKEWFVYRRFPGHEHVKVVDGVPEGWEKKPLSSFCSDIRDSVYPQDVDPETPYIGLEHIPRRSIALSEWGKAHEVDSNKFQFKPNDILFGKIRPYFHKVGLAITKGIVSSDAIVIRPHSPLLHSYCLMLVSSDEFIALASKTMREGSKMPRADWKYLLAYQFLLPPTKFLELFNEPVLKITSQIENLILQNKQLQQARDIILPRLMNGEIPV